MNNIEQTLQTIHRNKNIGLMTHVVIGYPTLKDTEELVRIMVHNGADIIELQIPFSDPLADGPTIMKACEKALENGTKVVDAFVLVKNLKKEITIPLLFMCYYNTIFHYGVEKFCKDAVSAGVDGLIVPDMPLDEEKEEHFYAFAKKYNLTTIHVVSPASTEERLEKIAKVASGFVYATAHQGITGAKKDMNAFLQSYLQKIRKSNHIPLAVGFGISTHDHITRLVGRADIAVIGSKLLDIVNSNKNYKKAIGDFLKSLNMVEYKHYG